MGNILHYRTYSKRSATHKQTEQEVKQLPRRTPYLSCRTGKNHIYPPDITASRIFAAPLPYQYISDKTALQSPEMHLQTPRKKSLAKSHDVSLIFLECQPIHCGVPKPICQLKVFPCMQFIHDVLLHNPSYWLPLNDDRLYMSKTLYHKNALGAHESSIVPAHVFLWVHIFPSGYNLKHS